MANRNLHDGDLRAWLRAGDPAGDDPGLNPEQATRIRQRAVAATSESQIGRPLLPLAALAAAAALAWLLLLPHESIPPNPPGTMSPQASDTSERRQIQFTTARGTRIVWTLDPDFEL